MDVLVGALPSAPQDLSLVPVADDADAQARGCALVLGVEDDRLCLKAPERREKPLCVDFLAGRQGYRLAADRVFHERLLKAMGGAPESGALVLDFTAGLGRDALVLAQAGFHVMMFERSPVIHALLADGLRRLAAQEPVLAERLVLRRDDALMVGDELPQAFGVLLDPMFPERDKKAAVKKDLQWLQRLATAPSADEERALLDLARRCARKRVVVKRPVRAPLLAGEKPTFTLPGKAVRFDVYVNA